ncbi:hypothetical protein F4808DRAFT_446750 [Astrocystis sublimbata]|nr:hypothetical protein F4808DRAFT_447298 [Astrocystis sublimbata]KAI0187492.1 hypothetical protein F4808DRAFT_446747 [Astrocystis sublimbata]KAI0187493.1 hypothetical protein F4808DRAFT_446750 [Astrocystis sublimbata]
MHKTPHIPIHHGRDHHVLWSIDTTITVVPMEDPRLAPCRTLLQQSIPSAVWFEDAVGRYGVPTVVFDLHLLVPDIHQAAEVLRRDNWLLEAPNHFSFLRPPCPVEFCRLVPAEDDESSSSKPLYGSMGTVLLSATDWAVSTETLVEASKTNFVPPLCTIADSMIGTALDVPIDLDGGPLQSRLKVMLGYLYRYSEEIKDKAFADQLAPEHRQFHLDCISGKMILWTIPFIKHERQVRDELRRGGYELRECSAVRTEENKVLFDNPFAGIHMPSIASLAAEEDDEEDEEGEGPPRIFFIPQ